MIGEALHRAVKLMIRAMNNRGVELWSSRCLVRGCVREKHAASPSLLQAKSGDTKQHGGRPTL